MAILIWNKIKWTMLVVLAVLLLVFTLSWESILRRLGLVPIPVVPDQTPVPPPKHEDPPDIVGPAKTEIEEVQNEVDNMDDDQLVDAVDSRYGQSSDEKG